MPRKSLDHADKLLQRIENTKITKSGRVTRSDTHTRLLAAALDLFARNGFEATTMREVASNVGIKAPGIYNHFHSKEQMLSETLLWAIDDFNSVVLSNEKGENSPVKRLHGILDRHTTYVLENPTIARAFDNLSSIEDLLKDHGMPDSQKELSNRMKIYQQAVMQVINDIFKEYPEARVDEKVAALAITSMYDQIIRFYVPRSKSWDRKLIQTYWTLTQRMLGIEQA